MYALLVMKDLLRNGLLPLRIQATKAMPSSTMATSSHTFGNEK